MLAFHLLIHRQCERAKAITAFGREHFHVDVPVARGPNAINNCRKQRITAKKNEKIVNSTLKNRQIRMMRTYRSVEEYVRVWPLMNSIVKSCGFSTCLTMQNIWNVKKSCKKEWFGKKIKKAFWKSLTSLSGFTVHIAYVAGSRSKRQDSLRQSVLLTVPYKKKIWLIFQTVQRRIIHVKSTLRTVVDRWVSFCTVNSQRLVIASSELRREENIKIILAFFRACS